MPPAEGSVQFSFPAESLTLFAASWKALEPAEAEAVKEAASVSDSGAVRPMQSRA